MATPKRFLIRHLGNMGDMVFFVPPVLETLKKKYPHCHITFVTAWGYKQKGKQLTVQKGTWGLPRLARKPEWGVRNQSGYCIALMMTNSHIDQLVHWSDTDLDLDATTCCEEGVCFPTWSKRYYEKQKKTGDYDNVWELDFGLTSTCNPVEEMYVKIGLPEERFSNYQLYFTDEDKTIAHAIMAQKPRPCIFLLEALHAENTRGWDNTKLAHLEQEIKQTYDVAPQWFGGQHIPQHNGRPLTLRQNIATLRHADVVIGVLSGPLHFAAAVGTPTLTLYGDQPLHRAAPAYFLNEYMPHPQKRHRTLMGPTPSPSTFLKSDTLPTTLTDQEKLTQNYRGWQNPGRQSTKSCLAPITVDEVMTVLKDMLPS